MIRPRRAGRTVALCAVFALAVSACGDDTTADPATPATDGTTRSTSTSAAAPSTTTTSSPPSTTADESGGAELCALDDAIDATGEAIHFAETPVELESAYQEMLTLMEKGIDVVPPEFRSDLEAVLAATIDLVAVLEAAGYDRSQVGDEAMQAVLDQHEPGASEASDRIADWVDANC